MTAVAESAPATATPSAPATTAAPAGGGGQPSNPLAEAIGTQTNQTATETALGEAADRAAPSVGESAEASAMDGEGDTDPSSQAPEASDDEPDSDSIIDAVQKLIARGVPRKDIERLAKKDAGTLLLLSQLTGGEKPQTGEQATPKEPADAAPAPEFAAAAAALSETLGLGEDSRPVIDQFAKAITGPLSAKIGQTLDALKGVIQFVEGREIDRVSGPLADKYPKLKTPEGRKALRDMLGNMNGKKFADYDAFVAAGADAAFAGDWAVQQRAERAKVNAVKGRSRAVINEAAPRTYSQDELATIRADMLISGKTQEQVRQHIERLTNRKG